MTDEPETITEATLDHRPGIMGIHASRAVERLKAGKPGDTITREEMAEVIGRSCRPSQLGYGNVLSAINRVEIDHGIVWRWDRGTRAWVCLDDTAKTGVLKDYIRIARKRVRRGIRVAGTVDIAKLTTEQKQEHGLTLAAAGVMNLCGGASFANRLKALDKPREPEVGKLIELMGQRNGDKG